MNGTWRLRESTLRATGSVLVAELGLFLLQAVRQGAQLPLQQQVLKAALLLHLLDGLGELCVQLIPLGLDLLYDIVFPW